MAEKSRPLIKICGITREEDARAAVDSGADAIGMQFYDGSVRYIPAGKAKAIAGLVADKALKVGLFVNAAPDYVREIIGAVPLDILQFHGDEDEAYCRQFRRPFWKALRVRDAQSLARQLDNFAQETDLVLDAWHADSYGGTGKRFDWGILDGLIGHRRIILAGGLNPGNVAEAVQRVHPWGVDVSSGVETAPGIKSEKLIKQFIDEVRRV